MKNPFIYGEVVVGEDFCDRERELAELTRDLKDGERIFLISPRRYGKSSLIANVKRRLEGQGMYVAYLDLFRLSSLNHFLEIYTKALTSAVETKLSRISRVVGEFLGKIRPRVVITSEGLPTVELGYEVPRRDVYSVLDDAYEVAQKVAQKRKHRFVVIFDEFQEIESIDGRIEKGMRAAFQHHNKVSYLFAGSKRHMMYSMVGDRNRAFYKMGRVMNLGKIPRKIFGEFLEDKFRHTGFKLKEGIIDLILNLAEEYPYNAQFICHRVWDIKAEDRKVELSDVENALESILADQDGAFSALWDTLAPHQRKLLIAIAKFGGENIQSSRFIKMGDLSAASSVQSSKKALFKKDLLDKEEGVYFITDVFFKEWIKRLIK